MTTAMDRENILYTAELRGEKRGELRGEKRGEIKGETIGTRKTALLFMERFGISPEQAAECTGLSVEELQKNTADWS